MQAAGKLSGKWANWSNIKETKGLITKESPFISRAERMYVSDFPDAVSDMKTVDLPFNILLIV